MLTVCSTHTLYYIILNGFLIDGLHTGTYKLVISNWPLLVLGTDLCLDDSKNVHTCIPFLFSWVKSEPALAYKELFQAYKSSLQTFFGIEVSAQKPLNIAGCVMDHAESIA